MHVVRFFTTLLIVAVFCTALVFMYQNQDETARVRLGPYATDPMPVFLVMLGAFLVGVVVTSVIGMVEGTKVRMTNMKLKRKIKKLQNELDAMRNLPLLSPAEEPLPPNPASSGEDGAL